MCKRKGNRDTGNKEDCLNREKKKQVERSVSKQEQSKEEKKSKEKKRKELLLGMMYTIHVQQWKNSKIYHCYSH